MREVIRCGHCQLNQYVTLSGNCRKCNQPFIEAVLEPVVVEVVRPTQAEPALAMHERVALILRTLRVARGYSQRDLSKVLASPRTWVSKIENNIGKDMTVDTLMRFATALDVPCHVVITLAEAA